MRSHCVGTSRNETMLRCCVWTLAASLVLAATCPASATVEVPDRAAPVVDAAARAKPLESPTFGSLPISFEPNVGQAPVGVRFLTRGSAASLTATGAVLNGGTEPVTLEFVGASTSACRAGTNELAGKANYLIGNDPSAWKTNVPTYASVRVEQLYPGVDLVWYGKGRSLEYDLVMEAGADPGAVSFSLGSAPSPEIDPDGALVAGDVRFERPVAYQEIDGSHRTVPCGYVTNDKGRVGFRLGDYDRSLPLVIDPEIGYTYTFADSSKDISISGIAVDSTGAAYVAGRTRTEGAGGVLTVAAFVAKLNPEGTALVYSTTISGSAGNEEARDIAVDASGNAFITGFAFSSNFPTTAGAFQTTKGSPNGTQDAFVTKIGQSGDSFVYSSFLGGSGGTSGSRISIDGSGNAHVVGFTQSSNFPTTSPSQGTFAGVRDAFLTKVNPAGSAKVYSTYLGGSQSETGNGVAVDASGNAYVAGVTTSTNFPVTAGTIQGTSRGGSDAFWAKYDSAGQQVASTYLGGTGFDSANGIDVDSAGNSYLTGETASSEFPLVSPVQSTIAGDRDVFVTELNPTGTALVFSTFYGGTGYDFGSAIAVNDSGTIRAVGGTRSLDFPTINPSQPTFAGGRSDGFYLVLEAGAAASKDREVSDAVVDISSYVGTDGQDAVTDVADSEDGGFYVGLDVPHDTGSQSADQGVLINFSELVGLAPDLAISVFEFFSYINPENRKYTTLTIGVRSLRTCGPVQAPDAFFSVTLPDGIRFDSAQGIPTSVEVFDEPLPGTSGTVTFRAAFPIPFEDDVVGVIVLDDSDEPLNQDFLIQATASTSVSECTRLNNQADATLNRYNYTFVPGDVELEIVAPPSLGAAPDVILVNNGSEQRHRPEFGRMEKAVSAYRVYASTQPNVSPTPGNLFTTVGPTQTSVRVNDAPAGSFFIVTAVTDDGESAPSNEVGGQLPTVTKLKVSSSKIVAQGTGFANDVQVLFGGLPFATAAKLKKANTKVIQKGPFVTGQSIGAFSTEFLAPGSRVIVLIVNGNGNAVAAEYTVP